MYDHDDEPALCEMTCCACGLRFADVPPWPAHALHFCSHRCECEWARRHAVQEVEVGGDGEFPW